MKSIKYILFIILVWMNMKEDSFAQSKPVELSQLLLKEVKNGGDYQKYCLQLESYNMASLQESLQTDPDRLAFWINIYNAFIQIQLQKDPASYQKRGTFFGRKTIPIAGNSFSFDQIEHGILRRSKIKLSLGYLNKPFPSRLERNLRIEKEDYRIHFALNCGAGSCPAIAFYSPEKLEAQLDLAKKVFLKNTSHYNADRNTLKVSMILSWFRADFGGKKGMINLMRQQGILEEGQNPQIAFEKYDWDMLLQNYLE